MAQEKAPPTEHPAPLLPWLVLSQVGTINNGTGVAFKLAEILAVDEKTAAEGCTDLGKVIAVLLNDARGENRKKIISKAEGIGHTATHIRA